MATPITNAAVVEFSLLNHTQPEVDARALCAALLEMSRINAAGHAAVELMMEETFLIDATLTARAPAP